jgi:hypothetical protein
MQARRTTVLTAEGGVAAVKWQLISWYQYVQRNKFYSCDTMKKIGAKLHQGVQRDVTEHLRHG